MLGEALNTASNQLYRQYIENVRVESELRQREEDLSEAQQIVHLGSWNWDIDRGTTCWSDEQMRLYGFDPGAPHPSPEQFIAGILPGDRERVETALKLATENGTPFDLEYPLQDLHGEIRYVHAGARVAHCEVTGGRRLTGTMIDITARKQAEELLEEEKERAQVTLQSIGDAVLTAGTVGTVDYLNPVAESLTGWTLEEAKGKPIEKVFRIINEKTRRRAENLVDRCLRDGAIVGLANHTVLISRSGCEYAIQDSAAPIRNKWGTIVGVVMVFSDVTEARRMSHQISHRATHDALIGLVNRNEFDRRLRRVRETALAEKTRNVLCFLDLDQFKLINDACGHIAGDELLRQIASLVSNQVRVRDTVARLGGDEFGLLMKHCSLDEAVAVADKVRRAIEEYTFAWEDGNFTVGVSIGLVLIDEISKDCASLMSAADAACYVAKGRGRNQIHIHHDEDEELLTRHREMIWAITPPQALERGRFRLFAQPIVSLSGNHDTCLYYEVLLRMVDEDGTTILPGTFLPAADRYNLSGKITTVRLITLYNQRVEK